MKKTDLVQAGERVAGGRIEISNPGGLPDGLSLEELGTRAVPRNRLIADIFYADLRDVHKKLNNYLKCGTLCCESDYVGA